MKCLTDNRPICAPCETSMVSWKNGVIVHYAFTSYQMGDLYRCPVCGSEIITGFGRKHERPEGSDFDYERRVA